MKTSLWAAIVISQIILFTSEFVSATVLRSDVPDLSQRYAQLQDFYNNADDALCSCSMKPLSQFHEDYGGCYWIIKNVKGEYDGDSFVIGLATYTLTTPPTVAPPGHGPLFPPQTLPPVPGSGVTIKRQGPAVVYREASSPDEVSLDGMGVTEFPTATHSDAENALAIALKTNISNVGPATDTSYLRRYSKNGSVALKEVFSAGAGTAIGYGYCWPVTQNPR